MPELVFCERDGSWATKFRQVVPRSHDCQLMEVRIISELEALLEQSAGSIFAIETNPENVNEIWAFLQQLRTAGPHRCVALIRPDCEPCSPQLRSLGFVDVISTPMQLLQLARFTQRHLSLLPEQEHTWREAIDKRLPWQSPG